MIADAPSLPSDPNRPAPDARSESPRVLLRRGTMFDRAVKCHDLVKAWSTMPLRAFAGTGDEAAQPRFPAPADSLLPLAMLATPLGLTR
jgi:hypothetical protein